ncbi:hypothetical protein Dimus_026896 [Dionaea muscipula]
MTMPIRSHLKRMKSVGHGPMGAKRRKLEMLALAPKELSRQEELPEMKSTSPEVSKSSSLSSQYDEEVMDAFWDTLLRVDDTTDSTSAGLALEGGQEERLQQQESIQERSAETSSVLLTTEVNQPSTLLKEPATNVDKGKAPVEINPSCPTVVPDTVAKTSLITPLPPTDVRLSCNILDSINQSVEERIAATYAMVDDELYPRDHIILLGTELRRLMGAMMVNVAEVKKFQEKEKEWKMVEERLQELEKKRDKREKEYQQRVAELREVSTWGQKLHRENGEILKQDDTHKTLISSLSIEVEEEKRKREEVEKKMKDRKKWEENFNEEERKKRKPLHDEIAKLKRNQEHDRSTSQQLQEDIANH